MRVMMLRMFIIATLNMVATVLENPGNSWNWGKKSGKVLEFGSWSFKILKWAKKISLFPKIIKICC